MSQQMLPAVGQASGAKPRQAVRYTPNVTPLIDVMFLLLLFFLLTTTFRTDEGALPGTLPMLPGGSHSDRTIRPELPNLDVYVYPSGRANEGAFYELGGVTASIGGAEDLYARLNARQCSRLELEKTPVVIRPRSDVRWGFVVDAYNQAARARFKTIAFAGSR